MELNINLRQSQILSAQQIQSMQILQMNHQELLEYIEQELVENPVLDMDEVAAPFENDLLKKVKWLKSEDRQNRVYQKADMDGFSDPLLNISVPFIEEDLAYHLIAQLDMLKMSKEIYDGALFVVSNLDKDGYLRVSAADLAENTFIAEAVIEEAIRLVRSLDPAGVGAFDLKDCLELQLSRMELSQLPVQIVKSCLDKVAKHQYRSIASALNTTESAVHAAVKVIRGLDPRPGAVYNSNARVEYIYPDILIIKGDSGLEAVMQDQFVPRLFISGTYTELLGETGDEDVRKYLGEKMKQAKWLINSIEHRQSTVSKCVAAIVSSQEAFFKGTSEHLRPLTLLEVGDEIGVHESTVSRAIKGKYLKCVQGTFPLSYFFSRRVGSGDISADFIKHRLREIIENEKAGAPLSDQKIVEELKSGGIEISRRTVAKYRAEMNIPGISGRKHLGIENKLPE